MRNLAIVISLALITACSSGSQTSSPGTLSGTISSQASALRVEVPQTALATTSDSSGHFVLDNVPAGVSRVHFSGNGVDASLDISAMENGEHRDISVDVSGNEAHENHEEDGTRFKGAITAIGASTITVNGHLITVTDATTGLAFATLTVGENVEVEGALQADGSVIARSITAEDAEAGEHHGDDDGAADDNFEFQGAISAISADGATLTVANQAVTTNASTEINGTLAVGVMVKVEGTVQADGSVLAREVKVLAPPASSSVDVTGAISAISGSSFSVGSIALTVDGNTKFSGKGSTSSLADFAVGDLVDVTVDGSLVAIEIKRLSRMGH
jgi:hypothetical protein